MWVCLKIGYISNYSHLIGIMISKTIGYNGVHNIFRHTHMCCTSFEIHGWWSQFVSGGSCKVFTSASLRVKARCLSFQLFEQQKRVPKYSREKSISITRSFLDDGLLRQVDFYGFLDPACSSQNLLIRLVMRTLLIPVFGRPWSKHIRTPGCFLFQKLVMAFAEPAIASTSGRTGLFCEEKRFGCVACGRTHTHT